VTVFQHTARGHPKFNLLQTTTKLQVALRRPNQRQWDTSNVLRCQSVYAECKLVCRSDPLTQQSPTLAVPTPRLPVHHGLLVYWAT